MRYLVILKSVLLFFLLNLNSPVASALEVDHFSVTLSPSTAHWWEALDLSIEALDKNDNVVTDYLGSILVFSETDNEAHFPTVLQDSSYQFEIADEWSVTFENAVVFENHGPQSLSVYDLDDDTIWGEWNVEILKKEIISDAPISIIAPENKVILSESDITISGSTQKNHAVEVIVNGTDVYDATSNSDGLFEVAVSGLSDGKHILIAKILNADKDVIWESTPVDIQINASLPVFKSFDAKPGLTDLDPWSEIELIVLASSWLTQVQAIFKDTVEVLSEISEGLYTKVIYVPEESGIYTIDIYLEDELSNNTRVQWVASLEVKALTAAPVIVVEDEVVPEVKNPLEIQNLKLVELKTKSILSWDPVETAESYNIYKVYVADENGELATNLELLLTTTESQIEIPIVGDEIKYESFAVRAQAKTESGEELYEWDLSEAVKIKTGPESYILFLIAFLLGWLFLYHKKQA